MTSFCPRLLRFTSRRVDTVRPSGFNRVTRSDPLPVTRPCLEPIRPVICRLRVNGEERDCAVTPHTTLLEALRYGLRLTGSKQGCDKGDCGACTVAIDGEPALACISLALASEGREITTIEGLATLGTPDALQDAFDRTGGAQCGFCTPGVMMSAWALLRRNPNPTRGEIAQALSGNLCRCTGYTKIFEAVELAAARMREGT